MKEPCLDQTLNDGPNRYLPALPDDIFRIGSRPVQIHDPKTVLFVTGNDVDAAIAIHVDELSRHGTSIPLDASRRIIASNDETAAVDARSYVALHRACGEGFAMVRRNVRDIAREVLTQG